MSNGIEYVKDELAVRETERKIEAIAAKVVTPSLVEDRLRRHGYVGHIDAVRTLAIQLCVHVERMRATLSRDSSELRFPRLVTLLIGPSGTGKSFLGQQLARYGLVGDQPIPYSRTDLNRLTEAAYQGGDLDDIVLGIAAAAGWDIAFAQAAGLAMLDELCKCRALPTSNRDASGRYAQSALLDLIEGQTVTVQLATKDPSGKRARESLSFDCSGLMVVLAGAFSGLADLVRQETRSARRIGFDAGRHSARDRARADYDLIAEHCTPDLLCRYGLVPELVGRLSDVWRFLLQLHHRPRAVGVV